MMGSGELIDGEHYVTPSPNRKRQQVSGNLYLLIATWLESHPIVSEYWVVDPEIDVVRVYRRGAERFGRSTELSAETADVLTTPLLPGLDLPPARIFRL